MQARTHFLATLFSCYIVLATLLSYNVLVNDQLTSPPDPCDPLPALGHLHQQSPTSPAATARGVTSPATSGVGAAAAAAVHTAWH